MFGSLRLVLLWPLHINSCEHDNMSWPRDHFVQVILESPRLPLSLVVEVFCASRGRHCHSCKQGHI